MNGHDRTPTVKDLLGLIEGLAPRCLAESWDNPGLQVGDYGQQIGKIYFSLDPTLEALRACHDSGAQALFTHHPLIFEPLSCLDIHSYPGNVIVEAVKRKISVVAIHTNLDAARGGINDILAELLGLEQVEVLNEVDGMEGAGLGRIGDWSAPVALSAAAARIKEILGAERLRIVGRADARIERIAVVGGSGCSQLGHAVEKGADLLLTGDAGHHHALEARTLGISLIDGGHFHTEIAAFKVFGERFPAMAADEGWEVAVELDRGQSDPMRRE